MFFAIITKDSQNENPIAFENVIFSLGIVAIAWMVLLTYISYELDLCFKYFIRLSIAVGIVKFLFWIIVSAFSGKKENKK